MKNIAIVEDSPAAAEDLEEMLTRYATEKHREIRVFKFGDPVSFLTNYKGNYDIVLMDIELPDFDGMVAAKKLRELDENVVLIFVTNMAQFAVKGYEVSALDFIVKPISYFTLRVKLDRAFRCVDEREETKIFISVDDGFVTLNASEIRFVEVTKHRVTYHTIRGDFEAYGTLKRVEETLPSSQFARCNHCYLVNMRFVTEVKGLSAFCGEDELQISHSRRKEFLGALCNYFGRSF